MCKGVAPRESVQSCNNSVLEKKHNFRGKRCYHNSPLFDEEVSSFHLTRVGGFM